MIPDIEKCGLFFFHHCALSKDNFSLHLFFHIGPLIWPKCAIFWPSLAPPADPVKFFWSKMACTCVPHIVLHVSCRTRTSGGYFRPSEVRFRAKIPLSSHWFYNVKTQKTQFLQNSSWEMAEIENIHCPICTQPIPSSWQNGLPPALATDERRGEWMASMCRNACVQPWIWSIWPILTNNSHAWLD